MPGISIKLVSLVGYTNAGKSTILRMLTGADVLVEDKLFATLDPTTRRVVLPNNETILITDTVGFIQRLPHHLVAAFRATLEEVVEADILLYVVDTSHPNYESQIEAVNQVLETLGAAAKPTLMVYNKIDLVDKEELPRPDNRHPAVLLSALSGEGADDLLAAVERLLAAGRLRTTFFVPYQKSGILALLHEKGRVLQQEHDQEGITVEVEIGAVWAKRVEAKLKSD
ncbi:MAG: GTPase HflX [Peptococcaceae bacterium MAG4]|nr:GTPase HflX [Peptococcaceae bacterium MAG4]